MLAKAAMTVLCMAGIAFYVRFLVALCKECKPHLIGYWVRLHPDSVENPIAEVSEERNQLPRAA